MTEQIKLTGVTLNWAFLGHKNDKGDYASGKYEATVIMNAEQAAKIKAVGLSPKQKIKETEDGMFKITLKSNLEPVVYNAQGLQMTTEDKDTVGNGTTANLFVTVFDSRGAKFAGLGAIRIKNLVKYSGGSADELADEDDAAPFDTGLEDD